jgi:nucleotide-binding universal stress UspA family protein
MTYKTIMVHVGSDARASDRLDAALALGRQFESTIVGVGASTWDTYVDPVLGVGGGETIVILREQVEAEIASAETAFKAGTKDYPHPVVWKAALDYPAMTMNRLAGGVDLIVASRKPAGADPRNFPSPTDLVMGSGAPVMLAPSSGFAMDGSRVLIGWKNTRETRRAVTDSLPLLRAAERVYVVQVAERLAEPASVDAELEDVIERLARHGVFAEASVTPQLGGSPVDDLMDVVASRKCGMAVFGAYGHSRLQEWVFGGVTADLLADSPIPVLLSR